MMMKKITNAIFIFGLLNSLLVLQGCFVFGEKDKLSLSTVIKQKENFNSTLTSVNISNNQITIIGSGFSKVSVVKISGNNVDADLNITSKSDSQIIASATSALSLLVGGTFDLIIGTADAQATYSITFTLDRMNASPGQVLKWNGTNWEPSNLASSQVYLGGWNATANTTSTLSAPALSDATAPASGEYYIVTTAGSQNLGPGAVSYLVGDWVMSNGISWDKIAGSLSGAGTTNYIPYYSSSSTLSNSSIYLSGSSVGIGTISPGSALDIKGTLRLSGATSGYVGFTPAAVAGSTTYTLPAADGSVSGQVLSTNAAGILSWITSSTTATPSGSASGDLSGSYPSPTITGLSTTKIADGSVTNAQFQYLSGVTTNIQTQLDTKQTRDASGNFSAGTITATINGTATNVTGTVAVANGGTGNTTLGLNQLLFGNGTSAIGGLTTTSTPSVLLSTITTGAPAWTTTTAGNFLQGSVTGAIFGPITNISPGTDFTITQNSVAPFTSVNAGAVANTLYLSAGKVGIGTTGPTEKLEVSGSIKMVDGNQAVGKVLTSDVNGKGSWQSSGGFTGAVDVSSTPYTIQDTDGGKAFYYTNNANGVINLPALGVVSNGFSVTLNRQVAKTLTITPNGSDKFPGGVSTIEMQGKNLQSVTVMKLGSVWTLANQTEECTVGQECWTANATGGMKMIYAGRYNGKQYFTTPGGCTNSGTPTCAGGIDLITKAWANNSGTTAYSVNANATDNDIYGATQSAQLATNYTDTDAAKFCENMTYAGYTDWYLPARQELNLLYQNSPDIGGFVYSSFYWSSTEYSATNAVFFNLNNTISNTSKTNGYYIRCVRRF